MSTITGDPSARDGACYKFRLFVTGTTPRSIRAILDTLRLCRERLRNPYTLEIVDLYQQPGLARDAHVLVAPTLVLEHPRPRRWLTGDFANEERVDQFLAQLLTERLAAGGPTVGDGDGPVDQPSVPGA